MRSLPSDASRYHKTEEYTTESVDQSFLTQQHRTKEGVWCVIVVLEGRLKYRILEPAVEEHILSPDLQGVVEPTILHEIEGVGEARFYVEFFR